MQQHSVFESNDLRNMANRVGASRRGRKGGSPRGQFDENLYEAYRVQIQNRCDDVRFMMWEFKIKMCNRSDAHEWTQCPHAHIGEKLARRDFLQTKYFPKACENMKNNKHCPKGNACQKAHNVFELWLHPNKYRTEYCTNKNNCTRALCFFAHTDGEKRKNALEEFQAELLQKHMHSNDSFDIFKSQFSGSCKNDFKMAAPAYNPTFNAYTQQPSDQIWHMPQAQYNMDGYLQQFDAKTAPPFDNETTYLNILLQQALVEINAREKIIYKLQNQGYYNNFEQDLSYNNQAAQNDLLTGRDRASSISSQESQLSSQMSNLNPFASCFLNMQRNKSEEVVYSDAIMETKLGQDLVRCLSK